MYLDNCPTNVGAPSQFCLEPFFVQALDPVTPDRYGGAKGVVVCQCADANRTHGHSGRLRTRSIQYLSQDNSCILSRTTSLLSVS
jgi:hypothetical protein